LSKLLLKIFTTWSIGALTYGAIEIISRGYTHISMGVLGGICLLSMGGINTSIRLEQLSLIKKMVLSAMIITTLEFATGLIVNIWLGLHIWDYSRIPFNFCGQICLPFFFIWFVLSFFGIVLEDFVRWKIFCEAKPQYRLTRKMV